MTKQPPGSRCAAALRKQATCASCVVRLLIVLKTRYARENVPSTLVAATRSGKLPSSSSMAGPYRSPPIRPSRYRGALRPGQVRDIIAALTDTYPG